MTDQPKITQILFATDLSENANQAFGYARSLADAYGAEYTVLHVIEKMPPNAELLTAAFLGYKDADELRDKSESDLIRQIKARIEKLCRETTGQPPECECLSPKIIVEPGKAADRILLHLSSDAYDALVIGSRGHGAFQEALIGGTAHKLLHKCRVPVLVIPLMEADR